MLANVGFEDQKKLKNAEKEQKCLLYYVVVRKLFVISLDGEPFDVAFFV